MIRLRDKIKSFFYKILRSDTPNGYNSCSLCKKRRKNWSEASYKKDHLIGFDKILSEWVMFADYNVYAKIWVINGYIVDIYKLKRELWDKINGLCRCCITDYLKTYQDSEAEDEAR